MHLKYNLYYAHTIKNLTIQTVFIIAAFSRKLCGPREHSRHSDSLWVGRSGKIFRTRIARPWDPSSLHIKGYRVIPGGKAAEAWRQPTTLILNRG